ncbi:Methylated-DNA--protein-cysteine methyltransferase, constitutive [bioreactor metagenome]|uniref:methylated-DNA--[protein]-cysteine S-methyltransferase n=1 Tax=bioreactor metagenome TaxID=1076179 RepID=A0A645I533_9ZZZZ|nr:methylated-DNA--[protein]-cysteine S-methyltransferase [Christensenella sp.]
MKQTNSEMNDLDRIQLQTPIGTLVIAARNGVVLEIEHAGAGAETLPLASEKEPVLNQAAAELKAYFAGQTRTFCFAMRSEGTAFQQNVWKALLRIPYGETRTYGEIASAIGNPKASRAVGMACNRNPLMIAVPCHRVIGADGTLTGYALGTELKRILLDLEQNQK